MYKRQYESYSIKDMGDALIIPGLVDLHTHAPQYAFRGLGMDLELLDWLNTHTFPEEMKYANVDYAKEAYTMFVEDLKKSAVTRAVIFATLHVEGDVYKRQVYVSFVIPRCLIRIYRKK